MRNLKRTLSLALAAFMLLGMMVVSASAADVYDNFSDKDDIVNKDAVSLLTILEIVNGKDDGSFDPTGDVTRAEMAKMIAVILNKGADNNDLYVGLNTGLTDVKGHWAEGNINYCYTRDIIAGRGDNTFDPGAQVTASEAAKMLLVAAGYNPDIEGFVGNAWAVNVNAKASALGIFDNYTGNVLSPLSRDDAALLIYNALDIEMIESYSTNNYALVYGDRRTILGEMYGVYKMEGVVVANEWAQLEGTVSSAALSAGKTRLNNIKVYESNTLSTVTKESGTSYPTNTFNVSTPVNYLGKSVTMYIRKATVLANSEVIGVTLNEKVNVIKSSAATSKDIDAYLKGTGLTYDKDTQYYFNYGTTTAADAIKGMGDTYGNHEFSSNPNDQFNRNGIEVEVIDNNNDGTVDYVLYLQETLSTVRTYSERNETITVDGMNMTNDVSRAMDFEDVVFADDVASQDLVLFVEYGGRAYISRPVTLVGTMTRIDRDKDDELYITVEGEEYRQSYIPNRVDEETATDFIIVNAKSKPGFTEVEFIFDSNGYIVAYQAPARTTNYALVIGSAWTQNALTKSGQVKILKADGTEGTYDINWNSSAKTLGGDTALETYLGTRDVNAGAGNSADGNYYEVNKAAGSVITYSINDENVLTINSVLRNEAGKIAYIDGKDTDTATDVKNLEYYISNGRGNDDSYRTGDGTLYVKKAVWNSSSVNTGTEQTYAIDLNTIAFYYYYVDETHVYYGVATGYNEMQDTTIISNAANTEVNLKNHPDNKSDGAYSQQGNNVQVYTTKRSSDSVTKGNVNENQLAEVLLINEKVVMTSSDYLYVLRANALTKDRIELNVVLEDGSTQTIVVKTSNIFEEDGSTEKSNAFNVAADFEFAWKYTDLSGEPKLIAAGSATVAYGYAHLIRSGTIVVNKETSKWNADGTSNGSWDYINGTAADGVTNPGYYTVTNTSNIWDVNDVTGSSSSAPGGSFWYDTAEQVVLVVDSRTNTVITGWVWDVDAKEPTTITTTVGKDTTIAEINGVLTITTNKKTLSNYEIRELVRVWIEDQGYADVANVSVSSKGSQYSASITFTNGDVMEWDVVIVNLTDTGTLTDKLAGGEDVTLSGTVTGDDFPKGGSGASADT